MSDCHRRIFYSQIQQKMIVFQILFVEKNRSGGMMILNTTKRSGSYAD